eukprot:6173979-Pleurochrysis_carterae.AAC.2
MPAKSGKLSEKFLPDLAPRSLTWPVPGKKEPPCWWNESVSTRFHARMHLEQLEDGQHNIVHVAKARGLALLGVVHPTRPVEHNVTAPLIDPRRARDRTSRICLAVLEEPVEDGAVRTEIEPLELGDAVLHVVLRDVVQESNKVVGMEGGHVRVRRDLWTEDVDVLVEAVVDHQVMRQPYAVRPHRVALAIVEVANLRVVKIVDAGPARCARHAERAKAQRLPLAAPVASKRETASRQWTKQAK